MMIFDIVNDILRSILRFCRRVFVFLIVEWKFLVDRWLGVDIAQIADLAGAENEVVECHPGEQGHETTSDVMYTAMDFCPVEVVRDQLVDLESSIRVGLCAKVPVGIGGVIARNRDCGVGEGFAAVIDDASGDRAQGCMRTV